MIQFYLEAVPVAELRKCLPIGKGLPFVNPAALSKIMQILEHSHLPPLRTNQLPMGMLLGIPSAELN